MGKPIYRRVVIKLSGEYFAGSQPFGSTSRPSTGSPATSSPPHELGVEVAVVVGGGNIFRGVEVSSRGVSRPTGDTMGMLATVMNCLALEAALERRGTPARTLWAFVMPQVCELFTRSAAHNIWPRAGSCCSAAAPAIRSSPPTPRRCCGRPRSAPRRC